MDGRGRPWKVNGRATDGHARATDGRKVDKRRLACISITSAHGMIASSIEESQSTSPSLMRPPPLPPPLPLPPPPLPLPPFFLPPSEAPSSSVRSPSGDATTRSAA